MREGLEATNLNCKFSCTVSGLTRRSYNKEIHILNIYTMKPYSTHPGCKESHFYSLLFWPAEASLYQPKSYFNQPSNFFMSRLDFTIFCTLDSSKKFTCPLEQNSPAQQQSPPALGYRILLSLHACLTSLIFSPSQLTRANYISLRIASVHLYFNTYKKICFGS